MFEYASNIKNHGKRSRKFDHQIRSCTCCGCASGIEIFNYHRKDDVVSCQVCGVDYLLLSLKPVKLRAIDMETEQECALDADNYYII